MELSKESLVWSMRIVSEGVFLANSLYRGDLILEHNHIIPLQDWPLESIRFAWIGPRSAQRGLWIIVCDRPFDRIWYEGWTAWAHEQGGGFEHMKLVQGCRTIPFIQKERPESRVLVRPFWTLEQEIWRP